MAAIAMSKPSAMAESRCDRTVIAVVVSEAMICVTGPGATTSSSGAGNDMISPPTLALIKANFEL